MNDNATVIPQNFQKQVGKYTQSDCVGYKDSLSGNYEALSWQQVNSKIIQLGCYLISKGIKKLYEDKHSI